MKSTKKTYKELNLFISQINNVIGGQETKIQKKLFKLYEKVKHHHESYNSQRDELRLDNAAVDEKGVLLIDEKGEYKFNKEGAKKLSKDIQQLVDSEFDFNIIEIVNPQGLESLTFLKGWTNGIEFIKEEEEEEL